MTLLIGQPIFSVATQEYYLEDAILAGILWGEWSALETRVAQGLACLKRLTAIGKEIPSSAVDAAASEFRYERDLVAASDAEAWLKRWGLSAEEWMAYIRRDVMRKRWADTAESFVSIYHSEAAEVADAMHAEMVCSGAIQRLATRLSGRAAMHDFLTSRPGGWQGDAAAVAREAERFPAGIAEHGVAGIPSDRCLERIPVVATLEVAFNSLSEAVLTPRALKDHIAIHHLDWIRFDYNTLVFEREEMAREAALCIREDDMPLADVAATSKTPMRQDQRFLDEIDRHLRDSFLGAKEGEVLGPVAVNGGFRLYQIAHKRLPSLDDPGVRERAEQSALRSAVGYETRQRVRWRMTI